MAKVILGQRPKTFKPFPVKFEMPDGEAGIINVTFHYKTKTEFGKAIDAMAEEGKKAATEVSNDTVVFSWEKFLGQNIAATADHLLSGIDKWDLDLPVDRDTLIQMGDELPAGLTALAAGWANACREGRLGN